MEQQKALFSDANLADTDEYQDIYDARSSMVEEQKHKVQELLTINENALIQMDKTCVKLSRLYENSEDDAVDPLVILKELTEKIDLYSGLVQRR